MISKTFIELNNREEGSFGYLLELKKIIAKQLASMTKEYIIKILFDIEHYSFVLVDEEKVVLGGACFKLFKDKPFIELVFLAVSPTQQSRGCGKDLILKLKEIAIRCDKAHIITYADNYACEFFKKQGFLREISLEKWKWEGFIK